MSCNRQNYRPVNSGCRPNSCVTGNVIPSGVVQGCTPGCGGQGGIVVGVNDGAGCGAPCANTLLEEQTLGMAYVPWQTFGTMYPMQQGLNRGTMFPCLDFDFMGRRCN
ncbi:MAG: spore coat associated protein CotJA [Lachnospiraceae bacterium]|nr:spore coat associated protein CotJA [Lachnospiraceae bacterium]